MTRREAVLLLIERYENAATASVIRMTELKTYLYEIDRPGFKTRGWTRYQGKTGRIEPFVVVPGNTHQQGPQLYQGEEDRRKAKVVKRHKR